ncbi:DUF4355 domain-containing protein [Aerococcaceae bacterium NML130460]|nr:DUF4355 domain-containing protein [Aerococcaceae bacterium NML130460]
MNEEQTTVEEVKEETVDTQQETTSTEKTFTQAEVDKLIADRVNRALKKAEKDAQAKADEAEKLRKMNAEQKAQYEAEKKDAKIAELEAQLSRQGLEKEASQMLSEHGLPVKEEVLAYVVRDNAEETKAAVNDFVAIVNDLADVKVQEMLKGKTPRRIENPGGTVTKEQFDKMTVSERNKIYNDNPELYEQLTN